MKEELFEVRTKNYNTYYVMAKGFDEANDKVQDHILGKSSEKILTADGSLNKNFKLEEIETIKKLGVLLTVKK